MAKKKITQKEMLNHFFSTFDDGKVLTQSEKNNNYKQQAFKLKNLKKVVKTYLEEAKIDTDKSVDEIIYDAITYAGMSGCKFKSIASIGYDILPKSIEYWKRLEYKAKKKEEEEKAKKEKEHLATEQEQKADDNNKRLAEQTKVPKWMQLD